MNPSIILLTICISIFAFLAVVFSVFIIKVVVARKAYKANSYTTITHFTQAEEQKNTAIANSVPNYKLANAK